MNLTGMTYADAVAEAMDAPLNIIQMARLHAVAAAFCRPFDEVLADAIAVGEVAVLAEPIARALARYQMAFALGNREAAEKAKVEAQKAITDALVKGLDEELVRETVALGLRRTFAGACRECGRELPADTSLSPRSTLDGELLCHGCARDEAGALHPKG